MREGREEPGRGDGAGGMRARRMRAAAPRGGREEADAAGMAGAGALTRGGGRRESEGPGGSRSQ